MATDLTRMPLPILVDLINDTNGIDLALSDITFSAPVPVSAGLRNTAIRITATPDSKYSDYQDLTYARLSLSAMPGIRSRDFLKYQAVTAVDLIPFINAAYLVNLQPEDYYDDPLPDVGALQPGESATFTLRARPGSFVWIGTVDLEVFAAVGDLGSILDENVLNGFVLQNAPAPNLADVLSDNVLDGFSLEPHVTQDLATLLINQALEGFSLVEK